MTEQLTDQEIQSNRLMDYFRATWVELKKVVWPTRDQAINLTIVVLAVVVAMTGILGGIDFVFTEIFKLFLG